MNEIGSSASLLDYAESIAETLEVRDPDLTYEIALQFAQEGDLEHAVELAETISDPYSRYQTVGYIAALSTDESSEIAIQLLLSIEDPMMLEMAAERVATRFARKGNIEPALEAASFLAVPDSTLGTVAVIAASQGFLSEAREVIASVESPGVRASTLGQVVFNSIAESQDADVEELLSDMKSALDEVEFDDEKLDATVSLGTIYQAKGENELALEAFDRAYKLAIHLDNAESEDTDSNFVKDVALGQIVGGFARLKVFDKADHALGEISDPFQFANAAIALALLYDHEHDTEINDLLSQAREIGNEQGGFGDSSIRQRDALFVELVRAHASRGNFESAIEVVSSIDSRDERLRALIAMGEFAAAGENIAFCDKGASLLDSGMATVTYWLALDNVFRKRENAAQSEISIAKAREEARSIEDLFDRSSSLSDIAGHLSTWKQDQAADTLLGESIALVPSIESNFRKVKVLLNLAQRFRTSNRKLNEAEEDVLSDMLAKLE